MINLNILEQAAQEQKAVETQQSPLLRKAAETAQKQEQMAPELRAVFDEVQAMQERQTIRNRLATYSYACGGNLHAGGGSIHIDPSKRGTFTAAASRHGMGVQEFASHVHAHPENYSPAMRRKANFARNAAKWHHAYGGPLNSFLDGGYIEAGLRSLGVTGFRVTSGYRGPNSKVGNAGKSSGHARRLKDGSTGAIDIVPLDKSAAGWAALEHQLRQPQVQQFLAGFGGTILDERDPATMRKTGATGPHFHIGLGVRGNGNFFDSSPTVPIGATYAGQAYPDSSGYYEPISVSPTEEQQDSFNPWWSQQQEQPTEDLDSLYAAAAGNPMLPDIDLEALLFNKDSNSEGSYPNMFAGGGCLFPIHPYATGDELDYGPYPVSEVAVSPTKRTYQTIDRFRKAVPLGQNVRRQLIDYLGDPTRGYSQQDRIDRFLNVYNEAGSPAIKVKSRLWDIGNPLNFGSDRAMTLSSGLFGGLNQILIGSEDEQRGKGGYQILNEMGHAYHDAMRRKGLVASPDSIPLFPDMKQEGKPGYNRENHYEYQAHRIINPRIRQYITGLPFTKDRGSFNTMKDLRNRVNDAVKQANKNGKAKGYK